MKIIASTLIFYREIVNVSVWFTFYNIEYSFDFKNIKIDNLDDLLFEWRYFS